MKDLDYYLLPQPQGSTEPSVALPSIDELISQTYTPGILQIPEAPESFPLSRPVIPQRIDPETIGRTIPMPSAQPLVPKAIQDRARMAGFFAQLSNAAGGLGRSGRNFRADPMVPIAARSAVINDYLKAKQTEAGRQQGLMALDLQRRELESKLQPKPIDELAQRKKIAEARTAEAGAALKEREVEQFGTEEERKRDLVEIINTAMKKEVASMSMGIKTLEDMAADIGLDPLKLRRARAAGGGTVGRSAIYDVERQPQIAGAMRKSAEYRSQFLGDPKQQEAFLMLSDSDMSPDQKRIALEPFNKEIDNTRDRLRDSADRWLLKLSDPQHDIFKLFEEIRNLKTVLAKHPNVQGWNEVTSSLENLGDIGKWVVDISNIRDPDKKEIMIAIRRYKEAYSRAASGAAIANHEWLNFSRQLGVGAFSNPQTLRSGVDASERILRNAVQDTWNTIDKRIQPEYHDRIKHLLPQSFSKEDNDTAFEAL